MSTPLLSYQLNPSPEPLMASPADPTTTGYNQSVLTLTASNTTTSDVTLKYLRLDLPLGSSATDLLDLTTSADLEQAVSVTPDPAWTLFQTSVWTDNGQTWASYLFYPTGTGTLPAGDSWTFTWQGVAPAYWGVLINTVPGGPVGCQVAEATDTNPDGVVQPLPLTKAPAGWFAPTLVAAPVSVSSGGMVQLSWNGPAGASYQLNGLAGGAPDPLPNAGSWASAPLTQDTVFTLQVNYTPSQGPSQHASPQQTVTVPTEAPSINSFTGTMTWYGNRPQLTLSWDVSPASATVTLSGNASQLSASGELLLTPTATQPLLTTYTLTAVTTGNEPVTASLVASYQPVAASPLPASFASVAMALMPNGSQAWICSFERSTLDVLDTTTYQPIAVSPPPVGLQPWALAFTPDGSQAWVANRQSENITVISTTTYQPVAASPLAVGGAPKTVAFKPDGSQAWIINVDDNTITVLDTATYQPVAASPIAVDVYLGAITFTPDGSQAWVVNNFANTVTIFDTATYQPVAASPVAVGNLPLALAFTPDGRQAWVTNVNNNNVTVLDTATYQPVAASPIGVGQGPGAIAFTPDGRQAWVANLGAGTVTVLDTATYQPVAASPLAVGIDPIAIAFTANGSQFWVLNEGTSISVLAITTYETAP